MSAVAPAPPPVVRRTRRAARRPAALAGGVLAAALAAAAILAPYVAPESPRLTDFGAVLAHPSANHLLGTDELGRDVFSRLLFGARVSLGVAFLATALALVVGVPLGLAAGYARGAVDAVVARATDVLLAFPYVILAIGLVAIAGPSLVAATVAIAAAALPATIRVVRGETLVLREAGFVAAAEAVGAGDLRIVFRQILPNLTGTLLVQATILLPRAILSEATLSFLGLGVRPPTASWGSMLQDAQTYLYEAPRLAVYPGVAIATAAASFVLLGYSLRDYVDPRGRR
jgi:peptide/nickel transport system permease protein